MLSVSAVSAWAQNPQPGVPGAPPPPLAPQGVPVAPPEKIAPAHGSADTGTTRSDAAGNRQDEVQDGTLSDELSRTRGTVAPPAHVDPEMAIHPGNRGGTMPVIPPPGTPGGKSGVVPK